MNVLRPYSPNFLSLARFVVGLLLLAHGIAKLFGFPPSPMAGVPLASLFGIAGILELIGGALLAVGLLTKPTAFVLSGMAAVAYFYVHFPKSFFPMLNGGEAAILFCFSLLYLAAAGGGPWSVDRWLKLSNGEEAPRR
jgi:putative oxidoreductase